MKTKIGKPNRNIKAKKKLTPEQRKERHEARRSLGYLSSISCAFIHFGDHALDGVRADVAILAEALDEKSPLTCWEQYRVLDECAKSFEEHVRLLKVASSWYRETEERHKPRRKQLCAILDDGDAKVAR